MAKSGFTSYTYEVFYQSEGRWTVDLACTNRKEATSHSDALLAAKQYEAVKVTREDDASGVIEVILEEHTGRKSQKIIKIVPIDEAALCKDISDYYKFSSRHTIGRLLRQYLDDQFITALELLFDVGRMNILERNDTLFSQAVQRVGSLQAKAQDVKPLDRINALYRDLNQIKDFAS
jgi:hypothetical protein